MTWGTQIKTKKAVDVCLWGVPSLLPESGEKRSVPRISSVIIHNPTGIMASTF